MRVLRVEGPGRIGFRDAPVPEPQAGEALLEVRCCGICGSDVAVYLGEQPFASYPRVPGHEFSARIVRMNGSRPGFEDGMLVTANPYFNCGSCYACRKGRINCCESNQTMGVHRDGAFAQYLTMPLGRLHDGRGLAERTLALVEPFSIGWHAVNRTGVSRGDNVLVIGAGPIGLFALVAAALRGGRVHVADLLDRRLELARSLGAESAIDAGTEDLARRVKEITGSAGMDVCLEAVGLPQTFLQCLESACFGGTVVLIGHSKREVSFNHALIVRKELTIHGSRNSLHEFDPLIRMLVAGEVVVDAIVTHVFDLHDAVGAFEALENNDGSMGKVLVRF